MMEIHGIPGMPGANKGGITVLTTSLALGLGWIPAGGNVQRDHRDLRVPSELGTAGVWEI